MISERIEQTIDEMIEFLKKERERFQTRDGVRALDTTIEYLKVEKDDLKIDQLQSEIDNYYSSQHWSKI